MSDTLFRSADLIEPAALVVYGGSIKALHGLYLAVPCGCRWCLAADELGCVVSRYRLVDPWGEVAGPYHVRRESIALSVACA